MKDIYLIYGLDEFLVKEKLKEIIKEAENVIYYNLKEENVDKLLYDASTSDMFGDKKYIVGENAIFLTGAQNDVDHDINYLTKYINADNHGNIVIFTLIYEKLDNRKKITKLFNEKVKIINVVPMLDKNLPVYVQKKFKEEGYKITLQLAAFFINYIGKNLGIVNNEIKKMLIYKDDEQSITKEDILNISSKEINDNIFDLINAIIKKDFVKIFDTYEDLLLYNEEPIKIIITLANQFRLIYNSKELYNQGYSQFDIAKRLAVHSYRVKLALESNLKKEELIKYIKKMADLDYGIKTGKVNKNFGLESFFMEL